MKYLLIIGFILLGPQAVMASNLAPLKWYTPDQVAAGEKVFQQYCASCHGQNAEATPHWKQVDANGFYPPPPLNGTAHAWHHDLPVLREQIREGGVKIGGQMPAFEQILTAEQIDQAIAFFQSQWPEDLYDRWAKNFEVKPAALSASIPNLNYLQQRLGAAPIATPTRTQIDKLYRIPFNEKTLFLSEDGEFAIIGEMIDLKRGINLNKQK